MRLTLLPILLSLLTSCSDPAPVEPSQTAQKLVSFAGERFFYYSSDAVTGEQYFRVYRFDAGELIVKSFYFSSDSDTQADYTFRLGGTYSVSGDIITYNYCETDTRCEQSCANITGPCEEWQTAQIKYSGTSSESLVFEHNARTYHVYNTRYYDEPVNGGEFTDAVWDSDGSAVPDFKPQD